MSIIHSEDWDGVTAPALPTGWTYSAGLETSAGVGTGITPTSAPNMLWTTANGVTWNWATYNTQDGNGGNVAVQGNFVTQDPSPGAVHLMALTARASATTLNTSSTSWYYGYLSVDAMQAGIGSYVSGAQSYLATTALLGTLNATQWYQLLFALAGPFLSLTIVRLQDGYWMGPNGQWQPTGTPAPCVEATDSGITGQGYSGAGFIQTALSQGCDNWVLSTVTVPLSLRPSVLVGRVPHAHYPGQNDGGAYLSAMS